MCLAYPGTVVGIEGKSVNVAYPNEIKKVLLGIDSVKIGDIVLVQTGVIIKVITEEEKTSVLEAWSSLTL